MHRILINDPTVNSSLSHGELLTELSTSYAMTVRSQTEVTRELTEQATELKGSDERV